MSNGIVKALNSTLQTQAFIEGMVANGQAIDAMRQVQANAAQAEIERLKAGQVSRSAPPARGGSEARELGKKLRNANEKLETRDSEIARLNAELAKKEELILEWMHSNESFKRLAKKYSKTLNKTDEQRIDDTFEEILNVSEENPQFAQTRLLAKAKTHSNSKP